LSQARLWSALRDWIEERQVSSTYVFNILSIPGLMTAVADGTMPSCYALIHVSFGVKKVTTQISEKKKEIFSFYQQNSA
jgi:hypothetical protein